MTKQFLETLWPVFGFARLLGMFPCKRKWNEDDIMELKPINWKIQWILFFCAFIFMSIPGISLNVWNYLKSEKNSEEIIECMKNLQGGDSVLDLSTFLVLFLATCLVINLTQYMNFKMRHGLCELSFQLNKASLKEDSPLIPFLIVCGTFIPLPLTFSCWFGWLTQKCFSLDWIDVLPIFIFSGLQFVLQNIPLFVFFGLTLECFSGLSNKIKRLNFEIKELHKLNLVFMDRILDVAKNLENVRALLSNGLFVVMTVSSIEILVMLYLVPANFINYAKSKESFALLGAGNVLAYAICFCTFLWFYNIRAQRVTNLVHQLKDNLQDIYVAEPSFMAMYEGQVVPASFMKDRITDKLNNFAGFDGKGYFVLGKSFLTNFLTFCATYFVILLQFKLSE